MRYWASPIIAVLALAVCGCTSVDHIVADRGDLLTAPRQNQTLGEEIRAELDDGCMVAGSRHGNACRERIEELGEVLGPPPPLPEPVAPPRDDRAAR